MNPTGNNVSGEQISKAVSALTVGCQRRFPPVLRNQIANYARWRLKNGATWVVLCAETGVSKPSLERMLGEARPAQKLKPVRVTTKVSRWSEPERPAILVRAPGGIIIEGLNVSGVAALLRELA